MSAIEEWIKGFETQCGVIWFKISIGFKKEELSLIRSDNSFDYYKCNNGLILRKAKELVGEGVSK